MIGFEMQPAYASLRKDLLERTRTFTGEAKGGVIRLLPALNLTQAEADFFLANLKECLA
jgi:acetylornithine aminotransferase